MTKQRKQRLLISSVTLLVVSLGTLFYMFIISDTSDQVAKYIVCIVFGITMLLGISGLADWIEKDLED